MIAPADVLRIKCKFVDQVIAFLTKRKYVVDVCPCELYQYYGDYMLATTLVDCLEYEQECYLNKKASKYDLPTTCDDTVVSCDGQLSDLVLSSATTTCDFTASTANSVNFSAYPVLSVTDDSTYIESTINIRFVKDCHAGSSTIVAATAVAGGCTSSGCSSSAKGQHLFGIQTTADFGLTSDAYISTLRVYETDSTGVLINTPIDLDLDPATSPYYTDDISLCPGCATVLDSEVKIGSANFSTAFTTLMENVSLARYSDTGRHELSAAVLSPTSIRVLCAAKHNPSQEWFGINSSNALIVFTDDATGNVYSKTGINATLDYPTRFYNNSTSYATSCGNFTPVIGNQFSLISYNSDTSFNKISLLSNFGSKPINVTSNSTYSCTSTLLTATYTDTNVSSIAWTDSLDNTIATTNTTIVTDADDYTFTAVLNNNCVISDTITVS